MELATSNRPELATGTEPMLLQVRHGTPGEPETARNAHKGAAWPVICPEKGIRARIRARGDLPKTGITAAFGNGCCPVLPPAIGLGRPGNVS